MIHALADAVRQIMRAKKFPHPVIAGPERVARDGYKMAIVFERDVEAGDPITAPAGAKQASPHVEAPYNRRVAGVVRIYTRSEEPGATPGDHDDDADRVSDGVLCAMFKACKQAKLPLEIVESRFLPPSDERSRIPAGRVVQIKFLVTTLVRDVEYRGAGPLTGTIDAVAEPTVEASRAPGE